MQLVLIAIGTTMPSWVKQVSKITANVLPADFRLQLVEIPANGTKNTNIARAIQEEGERMLAAIPKNSRVIALEVEGTQLDIPSSPHN